MPRQKSIVTVIRELVRQEVGNAIGALLAGAEEEIAGLPADVARADVRRSSD